MGKNEKTAPAGDEQKTARAMAALDAMATMWAATFDIRQAVKAMMSLPDGDDRLIAFIKQAHAEGLFTGRTSHPPVAQLAPVQVAGDAGPVARIEGIDEYGPRLEWLTHWVEVGVGTKLYTAAPQPALPEVERLVVSRQFLSDCLKHLRHIERKTVYDARDLREYIERALGPA